MQTKSSLQAGERTQKKLFLSEFYTTNLTTGESGWDINFAWIYATNKTEAKAKLKSNQGKRFGEVIDCDEHSEIVPLVGSFRVNTPDANLFIIR